DLELWRRDEEIVECTVLEDLVDRSELPCVHKVTAEDSLFSFRDRVHRSVDRVVDLLLGSETLRDVFLHTTLEEALTETSLGCTEVGNEYLRVLHIARHELGDHRLEVLTFRTDAPV